MLYVFGKSEEPPTADNKSFGARIRMLSRTLVEALDAPAEQTTIFIKDALSSVNKYGQFNSANHRWEGIVLSRSKRKRTYPTVPFPETMIFPGYDIYLMWRPYIQSAQTFQMSVLFRDTCASESWVEQVFSRICQTRGFQGNAIPDIKPIQSIRVDEHFVGVGAHHSNRFSVSMIGIPEIGWFPTQKHVPAYNMMDGKFLSAIGLNPAYSRKSRWSREWLEGTAMEMIGRER